MVNLSRCRATVDVELLQREKAGGDVEERGDPAVECVLQKLNFKINFSLSQLIMRKKSSRKSHLMVGPIGCGVELSWRRIMLIQR